MRKEELRHDPVRENIVKGVEYIKDNQNIFFKIFAVMVILVTCASYYNHIGNVKIDNASQIAGLAQNTFINSDTDEAMVKFERVLNDYPRTSGAAQSLVYLINDAISQGDYETVSNLISEFKGGIDSIDDPIVKSSIYEIRGDMALVDGNSADALSYYRKAENTSKGSARRIKYQLDIITTLIIQDKYSEAQDILEHILDIEDIGYNEKNKAEELIAYVNYKLGT